MDCVFSDPKISVSFKRNVKVLDFRGYDGVILLLSVPDDEGNKGSESFLQSVWS